jgi:hypothetical protein
VQRRDPRDSGGSSGGRSDRGHGCTHNGAHDECQHGRNSSKQAVRCGDGRGWPPHSQPTDRQAAPRNRQNNKATENARKGDNRAARRAGDRRRSPPDRLSADASLGARLAARFPSSSLFCRGLVLGAVLLRVCDKAMMRFGYRPHASDSALCKCRSAPPSTGQCGLP